MTEETDSKCILCPRRCNVDRIQKKAGYCGESNTIRLSRAALHMWEEPCISGIHGSGAVFFSGCPLRCIFCQNHVIATGEVGKEVSVERLADIFLMLQEKEAENINLVTAVHFIPGVIQALTLAKSRGLTIPVVYNSSGYEQVETLERLEGLVDIYLPDLKYGDETLAKNYSNAPDYVTAAKKAIAEMVNQTGTPVFDKKTGLMKKGVIVRHLILPGHTKDSERVLEYLYHTYQDSIYISIMNQFTPVNRIEAYPQLNRKVTKREYEKVIGYAISLGITNAFIQEGETAKESLIPDFDYEGV